MYVTDLIIPVLVSNIWSWIIPIASLIIIGALVIGIGYFLGFIEDEMAILATVALWVGQVINIILILFVGIDKYGLPFQIISVGLFVLTLICFIYSLINDCDIAPIFLIILLVITLLLFVLYLLNLNFGWINLPIKLSWNFWQWVIGIGIFIIGGIFFIYLMDDFFADDWSDISAMSFITFAPAAINSAFLGFFSKANYGIIYCIISVLTILCLTLFIIKGIIDDDFEGNSLILVAEIVCLILFFVLFFFKGNSSAFYQYQLGTCASIALVSVLIYVYEESTNYSAINLIIIYSLQFIFALLAAIFGIDKLNISCIIIFGLSIIYYGILIVTLLNHRKTIKAYRQKKLYFLLGILGIILTTFYLILVSTTKNATYWETWQWLIGFVVGAGVSILGLFLSRRHYSVSTFIGVGVLLINLALAILLKKNYLFILISSNIIMILSDASLLKSFFRKDRILFAADISRIVVATSLIITSSIIFLR